VAWVGVVGLAESTRDAVVRLAKMRMPTRHLLCRFLAFLNGE
jgi:hypothetical protein